MTTYTINTFEQLVESVESWNGLEAAYVNGTVQVFDNGDDRYKLYYNQNRWHTQIAQFAEYVDTIEHLVKKMKELNADLSAWHHIEIAE